MRSTLLDYDPVMKKRQDFHWSSDGREFVVETRADVTDIIELNKAEMAQTDERARWGEWARVARIPLTEMFRLQREGVVDAMGTVKDDKSFLKWLGDRDQRKLRTRPGRLA